MELVDLRYTREKLASEEARIQDVLEGFLNAAQCFNEEYKEEIEKEKEEYLNKYGMI